MHFVVDVFFPDVGPKRFSLHTLKQQSFFSSIRISIDNASIVEELDARIEEERVGAEKRRQEVELKRLEKEIKFQKRISEWEAHSGLNWHSESSLFEKLAFTHGVLVKEYYPDDPIHGVLKRIENGHRLFDADFSLLRIQGATYLADQLRFSQRIIDWEAQTGENWVTVRNEIAQLVRLYEIPVFNVYPDEKWSNFVRRLDKGFDLEPADHELLTAIGGVGFATRLLATRDRVQRIRKWERRTEGNWVESEILFSRLARKWDVPVDDYSPDTPVFQILVQLEAGHILTEVQLQLLVEQGAPELASNLDRIRVKELEYSATGKVEILAVISRLWRELDRPDLALRATGRVIGSDHTPLQPMTVNSEATLLTTRGAAFRDLRDLESARFCARRSIDIRPNHGFAYCLLGAIDLQEGDAEKGEENFLQCERLQPQSEADKWRQGAIKRAKYPSEYAAYLLDKNPERFEWARRYLYG
jgi:tetratricopeptide (TPR) repeat protein